MCFFHQFKLVSQRWGSAKSKKMQQISNNLRMIWLRKRRTTITEPEVKATALKTIICDYNLQFGTNFDINSVDLYYQDVQTASKRSEIQQQRLSNTKNKIEHYHSGRYIYYRFDNKYLNTLYVDKT